MGLSDGKVKTAFDNATSQLENDEAVKEGYIVKDYTKDDQEELKKKVEEIEKYEPDTFVTSFSSAAVMWDRIFDRYDKDKEPRHKRIICVVYHTSKKREFLWSKLEDKLLRLNRRYGKFIPLSFEEMPLYVKEVKKKKKKK